MVDRTVLAAVLLDELDGADDKAARFQSIL
jgi:hypothetical protein